MKIEKPSMKDKNKTLFKGLPRYINISTGPAANKLPFKLEFRRKMPTKK